MKLRDAVGMSVILHGILILSTVLSINFSSNTSKLTAAGSESYTIDYITISSGSENAGISKSRESLKTLTTPNNKSNQAKLKYFDKSKKAKKKNAIVRNQTKKKKTDKIAKFVRKNQSSNSRTNLKSKDGVRIGLSSGGSGFGLGNTGVSDSVFSGYFFRFKNKISRYWHKIPNPNKQNRRITVIKFKIFRNGNIDNVEIEKSSGNSFNDRAALRAIRSATPFERLPYQYNLSYLLIHFEFIWE